MIAVTIELLLTKVNTILDSYNYRLHSRRGHDSQGGQFPPEKNIESVNLSF